MFGYNVYSVIHNSNLNDTGIITQIEGNKFLVMFAVGEFDVEFKWYSVKGLRGYGVVG